MKTPIEILYSAIVDADEHIVDWNNQLTEHIASADFYRDRIYRAKAGIEDLRATIAKLEA